MKFKESLNESLPRLKLRYKGTRPDYKINDKNPYVMAIDRQYDVDGNGESILGINLNYYNGDVKKLIKKINDSDNEAGFKGFDTKLKVKKFLNKKDDFSEYEESQRKKRYNNLISTFPYLGKFIRRYKKKGIQSQKRLFLR
ncbi:MAG: hypothetical protein ACOCRO_00815 [Halanaerobiales bacterium]